MRITVITEYGVMITVLKMVANKSAGDSKSPIAAKRFKKSQVENETDWNVYAELFKIEQPQAISQSSEEEMGSYISICDKMQDFLERINNVKSEGKEDENKTMLEHKRNYICNLLISLKKINRLDKFRMAQNRNKLQEKRKQVDSTQLQLQNLLYEEEYLKKEILKCTQIRSEDDDIDLISIEEFYANAPECISKPDITKNDDHQLQLSRLEWELEQRKTLANQLDELKAQIDDMNAKITEKQDYLDGFNPLIQDLATIVAPLVDYLGDKLDPTLQRCPKLTLLPNPLFLVYSETDAYRQAFGKNIKLNVIGNVDSAIQLKAVQELNDQDESESELEQEIREEVNDDYDNDTDNNKKKGSRHHKKLSMKDKKVEKRKRLLESHPLSVEVEFESKLYPESKLSVVFSYRTKLNIVTVTSKVQLGSNISTGICAGDIIMSEHILKELFPNDYGFESPNPASKYLLKKLNITSFESVTSEIGFPYIWAQKLCGLDFSTNQFVDSLPKTSNALVENNMEQVMKALVNRFESKLALSMQIQSLETRVIPTTSFSSLKLQSSIVFWKYVNWEDYAINECTRDFIEHQLVGENDLLYQIAVIKSGAKLLAYVCIKNDYPKQMPIFSLKVNFNEEFTANNSDAIRDIERAINTNFQKDFYRKGDYLNLLSMQIQKLIYCFELFLEIQFPNEFSSNKVFLKKFRGRNRSLPFKISAPAIETISH